MLHFRRIQTRQKIERICTSLLLKTRISPFQNSYAFEPPKMLHFGRIQTRELTFLLNAWDASKIKKMDTWDSKRKLSNIDTSSLWLPDRVVPILPEVGNDMNCFEPKLSHIYFHSEANDTVGKCRKQRDVSAGSR